MSALRSLGLATAVVLVAACNDTVAPVDPVGPETAAPPISAARGGNSGPSASGHTNLTVSGGLQTFSFHARTNKKGTRGRFEMKSRGQGIQLHGKVTCLNVDGNEAVVVGEVTNSKMPEGLEGLELLWAVRDNGEGRGAADEWTDIDVAAVLDFFGATDCTEVAPGDVLDAFEALVFGGVLPVNEGGNVQVKP